MQQLIIIHNPSSGIHSAENVALLIQQKLSPHFSIAYYRTNSLEDLHIKTDSAIAQKPYAIIACGGDGTINIIAKKLVNTDIQLGIIPLGSGNGFANMLGIPSVNKACDVLIKNKSNKIDTLLVEKHFCCNVAGIGFDARVAELFANESKRGFWKYLKIILTEYTNTSFLVTVKANGKSIQQNVMLMSIANSNQWGNNVKINPIGNVTDGLFELVGMEKPMWWQLPKMVWMLYKGKIHQHSKVKIISTNFAELFFKEAPLHVDGEYLAKVSDKIIISLQAASLNVICR